MDRAFFVVLCKTDPVFVDGLMKKFLTILLLAVAVPQTVMAAPPVQSEPVEPKHVTLRVPSTLLSTEDKSIVVMVLGEEMGVTEVKWQNALPATPVRVMDSSEGLDVNQVIAIVEDIAYYDHCDDDH